MWLLGASTPPCSQEHCPLLPTATRRCLSWSCACGPSPRCWTCRSAGSSVNHQKHCPLLPHRHAQVPELELYLQALFTLLDVLQRWVIGVENECMAQQEANALAIAKGRAGGVVSACWAAWAVPASVCLQWSQCSGHGAVAMGAGAGVACAGACSGCALLPRRRKPVHWWWWSRFRKGEPCCSPRT